MKNHNNLL